MFGKHPAPRTKIGLLITAEVLNLTVICLGKGNGAFTLEHLVSPLLVLNFLAKSHSKVLPALPARINGRNRVRKYVQPYFNQVLPQVATMLLQFRVQFVRGSMGWGCDLYSIYNDTMMIACPCLTGMLLVTYMYQHNSNICFLFNQSRFKMCIVSIEKHYSYYSQVYVCCIFAYQHRNIIITRQYWIQPHPLLSDPEGNSFVRRLVL